jgi:hydrogenase maturation protease
MIAVIACGNANRSDDGAGGEVLRALKARGLDEGSPDVRLLDAGTDGMAVMFAARGCRSLFLVDACRSGSEPGAIFEVPGTELAQAYEPSLNLHDFRFDHALHAGRMIFRENFPDDVVVFLIEAETVALGLGLSAPVAAAIEKAADRIEALIEERLAAPLSAS